MKHIPTFEQFVNEAFMSSDINKTVQLLNDEVGNNPGYLFFAEDDEIKAFDKLWANKKYKEALDMLAAAHDIDATNFKEVQKFINESANEGIDTKYWAGYNTDTSGQGNKEFANKSKDFEDTFEDAVVYWNQEADGAENRIKGAQIQKIKKMAQEFFKKAGWISSNVIQAMIAQES